MKFVKVQQKNFLENVISDADYKFFKRKLKAEDMMSGIWLVLVYGATGARVSELRDIKVEHVKVGYLDLDSRRWQDSPSVHSEEFAFRSNKVA